ncbi:PAAR domain-containing protein [Sorangium sp. So ce131]
MPPAARVTDMHVCPKVEPGPVPHVGGPILPAGAPTVLIGFMPAAREGDMAVCVGPPDRISRGEASVLIGNKPAARLGDPMEHGGAIVLGCPTVMIGSSPQGVALSAATAPFCEECEKNRDRGSV